MFDLSKINNLEDNLKMAEQKAAEYPGRPVTVYVYHQPTRRGCRPAGSGVRFDETPHFIDEENGYLWTAYKTFRN